MTPGERDLRQDLTQGLLQAPQMSLVSRMQNAFLAFKEGDVDEAERLCLETLALDDRQARAYHLLGVIAQKRQQMAQSVEHFRKAVECNSAPAQFHQDLGAALRSCGSSQEAVASCQEAVRIDPRSAPAHNELGNALRDCGRATEAEGAYREAVALEPQMAEAHNNLGNALQDQGRYDEAIIAFKEAAALWTDSPIIQLNLGNCYRNMTQLGQAAAAYRRALALDPNFALAHQCLGVVLTNMGHPAKAVEHHREALRLQPDVPGAHYGLGVAYQHLKDYPQAKIHYLRSLELAPPDGLLLFNLGVIYSLEGNVAEAQRLFERSVELMPENSRMHFILATCLNGQRRYDEAMSEYDRALALDPLDAEVHYFHGMLRLSQGDYVGGWPEFKWRLKTVGYADRTYTGPIWEGETATDKEVVAYAEGGLGDTLHFIRFAPLVEPRVGKLMVEVQPRLVPLLRESGFADVVPKGSQSRENTLHVSLLTLPTWFVKDDKTIPAPIPYISARADRVAAWRDRLKIYSGFRVGIHWLGSPAAPVEGRSMPLTAFAPLADVPGVTLFSLQQNDTDCELAHLAGRLKIVDLGSDIDREGAFLDTAAILKNLDLLITCDTSIAHLAGAMGLPVWVALMFSCDWRWMIHREDTPWYPTMRLFRQSRLRDWPEVMQRISQQLRVHLANKRGG